MDILESKRRIKKKSIGRQKEKIVIVDFVKSPGRERLEGILQRTSWIPNLASYDATDHHIDTNLRTAAKILNYKHRFFHLYNFPDIINGLRNDIFICPELVQNRCYFQSFLECAKFDWFMFHNQLGLAFECLETAREFLSNAEFCIWTGRIHEMQAYLFLKQAIATPKRHVKLFSYIVDSMTLAASHVMLSPCISDEKAIRCAHYLIYILLIKLRAPIFQTVLGNKIFKQIWDPKRLGISTNLSKDELDGANSVLAAVEDHLVSCTQFALQLWPYSPRQLKYFAEVYLHIRHIQYYNNVGSDVLHEELISKHIIYAKDAIDKVVAYEEKSTIFTKHLKEFVTQNLKPVLEDFEKGILPKDRGYELSSSDYDYDSERLN